MVYLAIFIILSILSIGISCPVALANQLSIAQVFYSFMAFVTYCGVMCGIGMLCTRFVTKIKLNPNSKIFYVPQIEQNFYKKINLKNLKKIVPDLGFIVGFKKNFTDKEKVDSKLYHRFLFENVNASYLHALDIILSPTYLCILNPVFRFTMGVPVLFMVIFFNIIPVMIQRSLRPRLLKLYNKTKEKEEQFALLESVESSI